MELLHIAPDRRVQPYTAKIVSTALSKERMSEEKFANTIPPCYTDALYHLERMVLENGIVSVYGYQYPKKTVGVIEWDDGTLMSFNVDKTTTGFEIELIDPIEEDESKKIISLFLPIDYIII